VARASPDPVLAKHTSRGPTARASSSTSLGVRFAASRRPSLKFDRHQRRLSTAFVSHPIRRVIGSVMYRVVGPLPRRRTALPSRRRARLHGRPCSPREPDFVPGDRRLRLGHNVRQVRTSNPQTSENLNAPSLAPTSQPGSNASRRAAMLNYSLRVLLLGLVVLTVSSFGTMPSPVTSHHLPVPCLPDCP
jgi:hypothetical protein